jgi:acyl-coenzyme A thioesterase PaaI-like protein
MSIQEVLNNIKYVAWHNIEVLQEGPGAVTVFLPARDDLVNYVGTGHAGAIYTLAETAAGVAADSVAQTIDAFILLRDAQVHYTRRAEGDLTAKGLVEIEASEQAQAVFRDERRVNMPVQVDIRDEQDQSVFQGTFNYALRPRNR